MRLSRRGAIVTHNEYNGWTNYETWCLKLWIDNEEGSSRYWDDTAQEVYNEAQADGTFTRDERATLDLSDRLKSEFEEAQPDLGASMWADLLNAAMSEVNWHEIAEHYVADIDKESEEA
jgi:hypothetical protein